MSYGYVVHKNHVAQNETMIRYSFTTPRSAPSKANTDPKSTLWNLWSFWVFKKRNTTWACTSSLPAHSDLGPPTTFRTSMWDFLVREKYVGLPRKSAQNLLYWCCCSCYRRCCCSHCFLIWLFSILSCFAGWIFRSRDGAMCRRWDMYTNLILLLKFHSQCHRYLCICTPWKLTCPLKKVTILTGN